ncbi:MAG: cysteine desulfurase NifS [Euryarchaeota archaeon RBG_19FT_COMBO_56_21]|nr:MAG: cysteine desulfurase NifS [Euryarchaeota archaeon RBG_19FT_COMBO_56_21]
MSMQASGAKRRVYADYAAASPVDERVLAGMMPYFVDKFGNPSSLHTAGREPRKAIEEARTKVASLFSAKRKDEIVFTSGGTEASNIGIKGVAMRMRGEGNHIVTSAIEHISVLNIMKSLEKSGFEITYVKPTNDGFVDIAEFEKAIRKDTVLASMMYANNEIGTLQPIDEIGRMLEEKDVFFHVDAVAAAGKVPIDVQRSKIDLLSVSANDMYGPKGIGALYVRDGTRIEAVYQGGGQERGLRSGSENVPSIVGFGIAAELAKEEMGPDGDRLKSLRDKLIKGVLGNIKDSFMNGHPTKRLPNNANFRFRYVEGESMLLNLDMAGVSVASSSPCTSKSLLPSHVLLACDIPTEEAQSAVQFTLGRSNTEADIDFILGILPPIITKLRAMSPFSPENLAEMRSTAGHREEEHHHADE